MGACPKFTHPSDARSFFRRTNVLHDLCDSYSEDKSIRLSLVSKFYVKYRSEFKKSHSQSGIRIKPELPSAGRWSRVGVLGDILLRRSRTAFT